ncbi:MAG: TraM recognition domain-containing protein [Lachnospiraceae bacterium]
MRSREISASIILQSQSQLKTIYKDAADTIVGNCDSTLVFGRQGEIRRSRKFQSCWGKRPLTLYNQSENRAVRFSRPQLSEIRKGVDDPGRIGSDGRRQVYLHAAGRAPVPFG